MSDRVLDICIYSQYIHIYSVVINYCFLDSMGYIKKHVIKNLAHAVLWILMLMQNTIRTNG